MHLYANAFAQLAIHPAKTLADGDTGLGKGFYKSRQASLCAHVIFLIAMDILWN